MIDKDARVEADAAWSRFQEKIDEAAREHRRNEKSRYSVEDRLTWSELIARKSKKIK